MPPLSPLQFSGGTDPRPICQNQSHASSARSQRLSHLHLRLSRRPRVKSAMEFLFRRCWESQNQTVFSFVRSKPKNPSFTIEGSQPWRISALNAVLIAVFARASPLPASNTLPPKIPGKRPAMASSSLTPSLRSDRTQRPPSRGKQLTFFFFAPSDFQNTFLALSLLLLLLASILFKSLQPTRASSLRFGSIAAQSSPKYLLLLTYPSEERVKNPLSPLARASAPAKPFSNPLSDVAPPPRSQYVAL